MIWFTLALFVVSFLLTALLAPKPEFENARAGALEDVQFPTASENSPMPLVLGRVRLKAPNTLWYGDYEAVPITQKVKTGLFSHKHVVIAHTYKVGLHLGLCLGPKVELVEIYLDDELVFSGDTAGAAETVISINEPSLFGGYKEGGGWVSTGKFYNGNFSQNVDTYLEGVIGTDEVPAYNGLSHIVFEQANIGEQNNLRPFAFVLESFTDALSLPDNGTVNNGLDMNPMEALYQIMTDDWRGLGIDPADIDIPDFTTAGVTLHGEGNGCSVIVTSEADGKKVINEILRQVDGMMYQDPTSGKIKMKLIRDDYVVDDLIVFDEDDIVKVKSFTRTTWDEVRAQVKVMYPQRDRDSDRVAISQDMAVVATIGKLLTNTMSFPFVYDTDLATDIASRERAQVSVPLFRATIEMNRNANTLRPGDVFKFSWPEYNLVQLVMRVQRFDLGALVDGRIVVEAIQDNFAVSDTVFASQPPSGWVNVDPRPTDIVLSRVIQMPRFFTRKLEQPIVAANLGFVPMAAQPAIGSAFYEAFSYHSGAGETLEDGTREPQYVPYQGSGKLTTAYDIEEGFVTGQDITVGIDLDTVVGEFALAHNDTEIEDEYLGIIVIGNEWMAYKTAVDNGSGNWDLSDVYRGLFGSPIESHAVSDQVYSVPVEAFGEGSVDNLVISSIFKVFMLDVASAIRQEVAEVSSTDITFTTNYNDLPVRPGNLNLDGQRKTGHLVDGTTALDITWAPRLADPLAVTFEDGAAETPAESESYVIDVFVDDVLNATLSGTVAAGVTTFSIPFDTTNITEQNSHIRVYSEAVAGSKTSPFYSYYPIDLVQNFTMGDTFQYDTWTGLYAVNFKGMWALRQRLSTYSGNLLRVRDSGNGDAEEDLGFNGSGVMNSPSGTGPWFVTTIYDQSASGIDFTQTTNADQPELDMTGNPKGGPCLDFNSSAVWMDTPTFSNSSPNALLFDRPVWAAALAGVADTIYQYAIHIPHDETVHASPFYRLGFLYEPDEEFENRFNGISKTWAPAGSVGGEAVMIDTASDPDLISYYINDGTTADDTETTSAALSAPNTTKIRIGANTEDGEQFEGQWMEFFVLDQEMTTEAREEIMNTLDAAWIT